MNKEELIINLKYTEKKHRNDIVNTFDTNVSMMCSDVLKVLENCIEIPDGATNGDMIKAMFPNIQWDNECNGVFYGYKTNDRMMPMLGADLNWWNATYKKKVEE